LKSEYADIHARVAKAQETKPSALRAELTDLFVNHPAVAPHDACTPATAKMVRYKLANGKSLGHQIDTAPQHLWFVAEGDTAAIRGRDRADLSRNCQRRRTSFQRQPDAGFEGQTGGARHGNFARPG
jgi:hypothetical protein